MGYFNVLPAKTIHQKNKKMYFLQHCCSKIISLNPE